MSAHAMQFRRCFCTPQLPLLLLFTVACLTSAAFGQSTERPNLGPTDIPHENWEPHFNIRSAFTPDDPLFPNQWHLNSATRPHINAQGAWDRDITGTGVTIGIADDSMAHTHPDLSPNYAAGDSFDFGQSDNDPSPVFAGDNHGTAVSGLSASRGGNTLGVTGVAPFANLAGLRIDFPNQTTAMFVDATRYHSDGVGAQGSNIQVKNHSYGVAIPFASSPSQAAALIDSASNGTIHAFAAGNERQIHGAFFDLDMDGELTPDFDFAADGDANKKHMQSLQESIAVAALADNGTFASYSNFGANVFVTAPSSGGSLGITTTDRVGADGYAAGDYTSTFGGTSAASPIVAGVMALGKQANPALNERFAKHLLVHTSDKVDPGDATQFGSWQTNGAGNEFNQNYGFGLVNADQLTQAAETYAGVTDLVMEQTGVIVLTEPIVGAGGNMSTFALSVPGELEEVEVTLNILHAWRGDLEAYLTSPSGTTSRLMAANLADSFDIIDWTFVSNEFWGESPLGEWTLEIIDTFPTADNGEWTSYSVKAKTGALIAIPEPSGLVLAAIGLASLLAWVRRRQRV